MARLFDVVEEVVTGWPVQADARKKRLSLDLGKEWQDKDTEVFLRFGHSLADVIFTRRANPDSFSDLWLKYGMLKEDAYGYCLTRQYRPDDEALVRFSTVPGAGGDVTYALSPQAQEVVRTHFLLGDLEIPCVLTRLHKGARITVTRTGELEGADPVLRFAWDGINLVKE